MSDLATDLHIVPFEREDLRAIMTIEQQVYAIPWSQQAYEELLSLNSVHFWVAKRRTEVVGYMLLQVSAGEGELHTIAVAPPWQGCGIGSRLLEHLQIEARRLGVEQLFLQVRRSNARAQALYRKFGFQIVGMRRRYYQDNNEDAFIMRQDIA